MKNRRQKIAEQDNNYANLPVLSRKFDRFE